MTRIEIFTCVEDDVLQREVNAWLEKHPDAVIISMVQNVATKNGFCTEKHLTFLWQEKLSQGGMREAVAKELSKTAPAPRRDR